MRVAVNGMYGEACVRDAHACARRIRSSMDSPTSLIRALLGWATDAMPRFTNGAVTAFLGAERSNRKVGSGKIGGINPRCRMAW